MFRSFMFRSFMFRSFIFSILFISSFPTLAEINIVKISENLYLVKSFKKIINIYDSNDPKLLDANAVLFIEGKDAYLIDTPWNASDMPDLMSWIEKKNLTLKKALITHSHEDRSAGISYLNKHNIPTYSSLKTKELLKRDEFALTKYTFTQEEFSFFPGRIEVYYPGPGHTEDNLTVWFPTENILMGGCILRDEHTDTLGWIGDANLKHWHHSVQNIFNRYAAAIKVIPGHGSVGTTDSVIQHTLNLTKDYSTQEK